MKNLTASLSRQRNDLSAAILRDILRLCIKYEIVGSTVTCDPPPEDADRDFLILVRDANEYAAHVAAVVEGYEDLLGTYELTESDYDSGAFQTQRLLYDGNDFNFILMTDPQDYDRFLLASYLSQRFNLLDKNDRVALFSAVRYGNWPKDASFGTHKPTWNVYEWTDRK